MTTELNVILCELPLDLVLPKGEIEKSLAVAKEYVQSRGRTGMCLWLINLSEAIKKA